MTLDQADPVLSRARSRTGTFLNGKWRLDELIGVGGMAAVYGATHRNGARAAVKVLHLELSLDANVRGRFLREGYVANAIGHRGAVMVLDDDVADDGSLFLVMELLDGESLEDRCERAGGRLDPFETLSITDQLIDLLAAAHARGVIHRDIKAENIFVTTEGVVKVLDFGIARLRELSTASSATKTGTSMGTPAYMPPEQARGRWELVDGRSDLWAVGATMFRMLTGRLVHEAHTSNEQLLAAMTQPAPQVASVHRSVPPPVAAIVDRALAFDRDQRFPDAAAMLEAVRRAYAALQGQPISTAPRLTVPPLGTAKTLQSAPDQRELAVTGDPVTSGHTGVDRGNARGRVPTWALVVGFLALVAAVAATIAAWSVLGRQPKETTEAAASVPTPASEIVPSAVDSTTSVAPAPPASSGPEPPTISVSDLPPAATKAVAAPPVIRTPPPTRPPGTTTPKTTDTEVDPMDRRR